MFQVNSLWKLSEEITINLSNNRISHLNFEHVEMTAYHQTNLDAYHNTGSPTKIQISQNPIACDCFALDFVKYLRNEMYPGVEAALQFVFDNLVCESPELFQGTPVRNISPQMLSCQISEIIEGFNCTNIGRCGCAWRPFDNSLVIDCAGKNLTVSPVINHPQNFTYNQTEVHLENNFLENALSADNVGNWNITKLFLGGNRIRSIEWIPPKLEVSFRL